MRLPLLVAARPKFSKGGPQVPLGEGKWHIVLERVVDTILDVFVDGVLLPSSLAADSNGHVVDGPCKVVIMFNHRGSEDYLNVFAEPQ